MNTGQSMLTILALILLSVLVMRMNTSNLTTSSALMDTKFGLLATSVAQSEIEEITSKAFDQNTISAAAKSYSDLSTVLGPDSGETNDSLYNDVDDYNGYTRYDSTMPSAVFKIQDSVCYVSQNNLDSYSSTPTWLKKIMVTVTSPSMQDTIRVSTIYGYWYFR